MPADAVPRRRRLRSPPPAADGARSRAAWDSRQPGATAGRLTGSACRDEARGTSGICGGYPRLDPSEEGQHILRYESERTVVADRHILDAITCRGRDR